VDQTRRLCRFYSSLPNERLAVALDVLGNMIDVDGDELLDKTLIPALGLIHMRIVRVLGCQVRSGCQGVRVLGCQSVQGAQGARVLGCQVRSGLQAAQDCPERGGPAHCG